VTVGAREVDTTAGSLEMPCYRRRPRANTLLHTLHDIAGIDVRSHESLAACGAGSPNPVEVRRQPICFGSTAGGSELVMQVRVLHWVSNEPITMNPDESLALSGVLVGQPLIE
jgi:hypothetical protein